MNIYSIRTAGIIGFRGYSGAELVRLLTKHPYITPTLLEHRADTPGKPLPLRNIALPTAPSTSEGIRATNLDVVFLATPPEVSMELAPKILDAGVKVIDLSGAFRLRSAERYARWYGQVHDSPSLFAEAIYGLPEFNRESIRSARLVANPGCYPTAANLALKPLVDAGLVDRSAGIICDAKSGVSGAGRKASLATSFSEVSGNFSAYGFSDHRHVPEVLQISGLKEDEFTFTAQLLPLHRGILETIYLRTTGIVSADNILDVYQSQYRNEPFIRLYAPGKIPDLSAVQNTNFCDIGFRLDATTGRLLIVAVEDNLVKGAAGQAVQNMNLMLGFDEAEGLL